GRVSPQRLRRGITELSAKHTRRGRDPALSTVHARDTEAEQIHVPGAIQDDIVGGDVPMHDPTDGAVVVQKLVSVLERIEHAAHDEETEPKRHLLSDRVPIVEPT